MSCIMDYVEAGASAVDRWQLLGSKGTTGTQASFMELFGGDSAKIKAVEQDYCRRRWALTRWCRCPGRPIPARWTICVVSALSGIAQSRQQVRQ